MCGFLDWLLSFYAVKKYYVDDIYSINFFGGKTFSFLPTDLKFFLKIYLKHEYFFLGLGLLFFIKYRIIFKTIPTLFTIQTIRLAYIFVLTISQNVQLIRSVTWMLYRTVPDWSIWRFFLLQPLRNRWYA